MIYCESSSMGNGSSARGRDGPLALSLKIWAVLCINSLTFRELLQHSVQKKKINWRMRTLGSIFCEAAFKLNSSINSFAI